MVEVPAIRSRPRAPLAVGLLAAALLTVAMFAACGGDGGPPPASQPVEDASIVAITTEDGLRLDARLFAADGRRLVLLLHMYPADQRSWYDFARALRQDGVSALTLDFRGYGASEGEKDAENIDRDARAALAFARAQGYESVMLVGASMGGTVAILAAAAEPVAGVITLSAPISFRGLDAESAAGDLAVPLAVMASRGDRSAADSLARLAERAGLDERHAVLYEGRAHGTDMLTGQDGAQVWARLRELIAEFWSR